MNCINRCLTVKSVIGQLNLERCQMVLLTSVFYYSPSAYPSHQLQDRGHQRVRPRNHCPCQHPVCRVSQGRGASVSSWTSWASCTYHSISRLFNLWFYFFSAMNLKAVFSSLWGHMTFLRGINPRVFCQCPPKSILLLEQQIYINNFYMI